MGQCVTINVGNDGSVAPTDGQTSGTNVSVGAPAEEEEEEEEEEGMCSCIEEGNCLPCL
jgi:hypothetical protein